MKAGRGAGEDPVPVGGPVSASKHGHCICIVQSGWGVLRVAFCFHVCGSACILCLSGAILNPGYFSSLLLDSVVTRKSQGHHRRSLWLGTLGPRRHTGPIQKHADGETSTQQCECAHGAFVMHRKPTDKHNRALQGSAVLSHFTRVLGR